MPLLSTRAARVASAALSVFTLACMVGFAAVSDNDQNNVFAAWVTGLATYFAWQAVGRSYQNPDELLRWRRTLVAFHGVGAFVSLVLFFLYGIGMAWAAFVLSLTLVAAHALVIAVVRAADPDLGATKPASSCGRTGFKWCNCFFVSIALVLNLLLLGGGGYAASQRVLYSPRGTFTTFKLADGRPQTFHYQCEGGNSTTPTIFLLADQSHGVADFWPLQRELTKRGLRSCPVDLVGLGYSDNPYPGQTLNQSLWMDSFLESTKEPKPWILAGWGGGGPTVLEYTVQNPAKVRSLVFLAVYTDGVEWRGPWAKYPNQTAAEVERNRALQIRGRLFLFGIIRGLGLPWGLMAPLVPADPAGYAWPERFDEYRINYLTGKTWNVQQMTLREMNAFDAKNPFQSPTDRRWLWDQGSKSIAGKPVLGVVPAYNESDVCWYIPDKQSTACADAKWNGQFNFDDAVNATNVTGNGRVTYCIGYKCDQGLIMRFPALPAQAIEDGLRTGFL